jgi:cytidylate kinase
VIFPHAGLKLYLRASPEVRARRRAEQLALAGISVDPDELQREIAGRDALDEGRAVSPLRPAPDAHIIDSGLYGIEEMVDVALGLCRQAGLIDGGES